MRYIKVFQQQKTADELIDNIQKAVYKTKVYNANYLTPENISHAEDFENLVKAANQKIRKVYRLTKLSQMPL